MPYIDFSTIKEQLPIDKVVALLGLKVVKSGHQLRAACPTCQQGGDRALAITPAKGLFYCFPAQTGGDQITLAAHIRNTGVKEAADFLAGTVQVPSTVPVQNSTVRKNNADSSPSPGFQALDYLEPGHPAVEAVGFDQETAKALGIGFAGKGILRGTVAVPVRLEDGTLAGYIGITEAKLPPKWHLPETNVIRLPKKTA